MIIPLEMTLMSAGPRKWMTRPGRERYNRALEITYVLACTVIRAGRMLGSKASAYISRTRCIVAYMNVAFKHMNLLIASKTSRRQ